MPPFQQSMQMMLQVQSSAFVTELIYSFVIILASLMIYFGTRELYNLSKYKGLKYFRYAFLFFALAFFSRYAIKAILFLFEVNRIMDIDFPFVGPLSLFIFVYANAIGMLYLLYSLIWEKFEGWEIIMIFHLTALILATIIINFPNNLIYLIINMIFLIISLYVVIIAYKKSKENNKQNNLYIIYFLLFISNLLNIVDILIPSFFQLYQSIIYIASISIFLTILYKVLKKTGAD